MSDTHSHHRGMDHPPLDELADIADAVQDARDEAELRARRRNPVGLTTASSRSFAAALGLYVSGDHAGAAYHLGRAAATLRRSFYQALEETIDREERTARQAEARAAGALCACGAPAEALLGPGATGPCATYPNCGFYPLVFP